MLRQGAATGSRNAEGPPQTLRRALGVCGDQWWPWPLLISWCSSTVGLAIRLPSP